MNTKSKDTVELVKMLASVIEVRKEAEKREKILKAQVKELMGSELVLTAGNHVVVIESRTRTDLDKDAIMHDMGQAFFTKYSTKSSYDIMSVKLTTRAEVANG